jgi:hypothetical protein
MTRDEILNRIATVKSLLKRQLSKREREEAQSRLAELEDELRRLDESIDAPIAPDKVKAEIEKIWEILKR